MSHFKTQQEIWEYLVDGGKVRGVGWILPSEYICFQDGTLYNSIYGCPLQVFETPTDWFPYEEPKPKRKFYRRKWVCRNDSLLTDTQWATSKQKFDENYVFSAEVSDEWEEIEI